MIIYFLLKYISLQTAEKGAVFTVNRRASGAKSFILNFFIFFFSAVFIVSATIYIMLGPVETARREQEKQELADEYSFDVVQFESRLEENNNEQTEDKPYVPSFFTMLHINEEIRAWINIPGTNVDYPILKSESDDKYYLTHNYKKQKASEGALYFDRSNKLDGTDSVLVVYGHNMRDGSMLATTKRYRDEEFYRQNKYIYLDTDYEAEKYQIMSVFTQNVDPNIGKVFKYNKTEFESDAEFVEHMNKMRSKSFYQTDAPQVTADSKILVLQTCTNGTGIYNDDRFVVVGIKIN